MASKDQTIALAGIFQALTLIQSIAYRGSYDPESYTTSLQSILNVNADTTLDVFGDKGAMGLKLGIKALLANLEPTSKSPQALEITRYFIAIAVLEKKLMRNPDMLDTLTRGIDRVRQQSEHFALDHENIAESLAALYKQTISELEPKIMINGERDHLHNKSHAARIRALLLAAIRSAVLWEQKGGVRWRLMFERRRIYTHAEELLAEAG
jgi:high frequency lysogenization protein